MFVSCPSSSSSVRTHTFQAYPYGRGKFETVGTFLVACSLISSGAGIAYHAIEGVRAAALPPSDPKREKL